MKKLIIPLLVITNLAIAQSNDRFSFQGSPINPACVALFDKSEADLPYIQAIILNNCQHSNVAYQTTRKAQNGSYYFYTNDKNDRSGKYSYKVLGKTTNGIYILTTQSSSGGSMVASDLLLIRLYTTHWLNNITKSNGSSPTKLGAHKITVMQLIGYLIGGDRCTGSFHDVQVDKNKLHIKQYAGTTPNDCSTSLSYTIDLNHDFSLYSPDV